MKNYPNFKSYHNLIKSYLNVDKKVEELAGAHLFECDENQSQKFFFELINRATLKMIKLNDCSGIGDINPLGFNMVQDFNTSLITYAGQQILRFRNMEDYQSSYLESMITKVTRPENVEPLFMQTIQEGAAIKLLDFYLDKKPREPKNIMDDWVHFRGEEWKSFRCAFYRYMMYSGFIQVDKDAEIIKDSIPKLELLSELVERFIELYNLRKEYNESNLSSKFGETVEEALGSPEKLAINFLKFNKVEPIAVF